MLDGEERDLVEVRDALERGEIGWSMADLLSRHVTRENAAQWLEVARTQTVRAMQVELTGREVVSHHSNELEATVRPTRWLTPAELSMLSVSRVLVDHVSAGVQQDREEASGRLNVKDGVKGSAWFRLMILDLLVVIRFGLFRR